jgi:glycosyltransferase involved in cell wall biosynthesis
MTAADREHARVAILPWGNVIEDYLDGIGVSFESFCEEMSGGWLFGYVEALEHAGVGAALVCVSERQPAGRYLHRPTGAEVHVLEVTGAYRRLRRLMRDPYGWSFERMFGPGRSRRRLLRLVRVGAPYLPTPPLQLARALRGMGCSALLCQEYEYPRFDLCTLLGRLLGMPVFATFQGGDYQLSRLERVLRPVAMRASAGFVVPTSSEAARIRERYRVPPEKIARILNPIDLELWRPLDRREARASLGLPSDVAVVAWHGRVEMYGKGLDVLLDAWRHLGRDGNRGDARLLLVGEGPDADHLRARLADEGHQGVDWVAKYLLDRDEMRRYLSAADVYVFPSRHEGLPVAAIEAMACHLPVVAADAPGVADILEGGERHGGVLVPRGDAVSLAAALGELLSDRDRAARLGLLARERVEASFSIEAVGEKLGAFLAPEPPSRRHAGP